MPNDSPFAKIPVPTFPEAMSGPAQMQEIVNAIDPNILLHAVSIGDRDSQYGELPAGSVVTTTQPPWYVWLRSFTVVEGITVPGWVTLYEFTDWQEFPSTVWASGWSDVASRWSRFNGRIDFYLRANYSGDDVTGNPTNGGNISDIPVMLLPSQVRPVLGQVPIQFLASTCGNINVSVNGNVAVTHLYPGGTLAGVAGTVVTASKTWRKG